MLHSNDMRCFYVCTQDEEATVFASCYSLQPSLERNMDVPTAEHKLRITCQCNQAIVLIIKQSLCSFLKIFFSFLTPFLGRKT